MHEFNLEKIVVPFCYEGDTGDTGDTGDAGDTGDTGDTTFTQTQVDSMIAERLAKKDKSVAKTLEELETLKGTIGDKDGQVDNLNALIGRIKKEGMTKEQLLREEATNREKVLSDERDGLVSDRDSWKSRFQNTEIDNAIIKAAASEELGAVNPAQILRELGPMSELVAELDGAGKETGRLVPMINLETKDESGKKVTLQLTVPEAVKRHREMPENWNLYKSNLKGGFGGSGGQTGGGDDEDAMSDDEFYASRQKGTK